MGQMFFLSGVIKSWNRDYHEQAYCQKYSWDEYNDFNFMINVDKTANPDKIGFQTHQETYYKIGKSTLYSILVSLEFGLEIAQEALIEHDQYLGRTIMKNKMWAEELEREIEKFKNRIKEVKGILNHE